MSSYDLTNCNHPDFLRLDQLRRGLTVHRYHTHRVIRPQSVGEHSAGVALIAKYLCEAEGKHEERDLYYVVQSALEHDLAEHASGDNPAPAKRRSPALKAALNELEAETNRELKLTACDALDATESAIIGMADELDFLWYTLDERRLGNADMETLWFRGSLGLTERIAKHREAGTIKIETALAADRMVVSIGVEIKALVGATRYYTQAAHFMRERENGR